MSPWALMRRYGLHKRPLFLAKYSRAGTAPSFLRVAEALLEVDGCKVLGKDFEAVSRVKYSVKRRLHIDLSVVRVLHLFGASFGARALCLVNSLPLVSLLSSVLDFNWQSEKQKKFFFLLGELC